MGVSGMKVKPADRVCAESQASVYAEKSRLESQACYRLKRQALNRRSQTIEQAGDTEDKINTDSRCMKITVCKNKIKAQQKHSKNRVETLKNTQKNNE